MDFCTAVNCIDGRVQIPVIRHLQRCFGVSYVDMVTEAGAVRALSEPDASESKESIVRRVGVSIDAHESGIVSVVAHADCAGNRVGRERQLKQLAESLRFLAEHFSSVSLVGLWVDEDGEVTEVCGLEPDNTLDKSRK